MWLRSSWTWTGVAASAFISGKSTPSHDGLYHRVLLTSAVDALILNFFIHRKLLDLQEGIKLSQKSPQNASQFGLPEGCS